MTPVNQKKLYDKYPSIFRRRLLPPDKTCMCWGLDIGDGWYDIIDEICEGIQNLRYEYGIDIVTEQVKEKYGTLRFYTTTIPKLLKLTEAEYAMIHSKETEIISAGELKSSVTCEECGKPGTETGRGWIRVLCPSCEKLLKKVRL